MAEGDTILRLARRIEGALAGQAVAVRAPHPRGRAAGVERLDGATLISAEARGKHLLVHFHPENAPQRTPGERPRLLVLHSHLGMSGGWHFYRPGERWRRSQRAAWVVISAATARVPRPAVGRGRPGPGRQPAGLDLVQFGGPTLRILRPEQLRRDPTFTTLGPDILAPAPFDLVGAVASLRSGGEDAALGEALLDQHRIAGIGNIFKSEGCFAAGLDPWRRLAEIGDEELVRVLRLTREMMLASVAGKPRPRQVYRRVGEPCRRCGGPIQSRGQGEANRTTYWCRTCQG